MNAPNRLVLFTLAIVLTLAGCATPRPAPTLYEQFGAEPGLAALVDDLLERFADDPRVGVKFANTNIPRFRRLFIEHLCQIMDGPCTYTGDRLEEAHRGLSIDEGTFNAVVEHLIDAMDAQRIPTRAQNRLIAKLAAMRKDVIYK